MKGSAVQKGFWRFASSQYRRLLLNYLWLYPFFAAAVYIASSLFITDIPLRIILAVALSPAPWLETVKAVSLSSRSHIRTQLTVLLQVLTTSISSGYSTEKSLTLARPVIEKTFGRKCILVRPLTELENNIKVHSDLTDSLDRFSRELEFPETVPVFHALAISSRIGSSGLAILRSSCQMLSDMNAVAGDIRAANAGKNAEAFMLCIMPFGITWALHGMSGDYMDSIRGSASGSMVMMAAFATAVLASALLLKFISNNDASSGYREEKRKKLVPGSLPDRLATYLIRRFPAGLLSSRHELLSELYLDPDTAYREFIVKQSVTASVLTAVSAVILLMLGKPLIFCLAFTAGSILLGGYDLRRKADLKKEDIMKDIPLFFCLASTLLQAGLQLPKTIEVCSDAFDRKSALAGELSALRAMILSGIPASDAVERFSLRIKIPEAQAALLLIARYGRLGTAEVLGMLSLQSSSCWNLCRNAARKKQERQALGLLLPMTLDFICVLLVATTPAIISMGI